MSCAYYNEIDPYAAQWLRNLVTDGLIPCGDVDERSIADVQPDDVRGYAQAHFFAGLGGWAYALRLAGWPDDHPIWTGSCPCQPFSVAGKGRGIDDERHLWPDFFRLIRAARPAVVMGEQVAGSAGYGWLDGVRTDLAGEGYASRGVDIPACAVDAPHIRSRIYWVAVADAEAQRPPAGACVAGDGRAPAQPQRHGARGGALGDALLTGLSPPEREVVLGTGRGSEGRAVGEPSRALGDAERQWLRSEGCGTAETAPRRVQGKDRQRQRLWPDTRTDGLPRNGTFWSDAEWLTGADRKARRVKPGIRLLVNGVPARVAKLRVLGNAIVPQVAAEVIASFMECAP